MSSCNNDHSRTQATIVCANTQLCAGLGAGIEGNPHAVQAIWPQSTGWTHNRGIPDDDYGDDPDDGDAPMTQLSQVEDSLVAEDPLIDVGANKDIK